MKKGEQTKLKASTLLHMIYLKCEMRTPFTVVGLLQEISFTANAGTIIKRKNIIERVKREDSGYVHKWLLNGPPTKELIESVATEIKEYTRSMAINKKSHPVASVSVVESAQAVETIVRVVSDPLPALPALPPNMPAPLQVLYNMLVDQHNILVDQQVKIDYLYNQFKN